MTGIWKLKEVADRVGLPELSDVDLLRVYAATLNELKARSICRSNNNPVADYAEWLASTRLGLTLETKSNAGFDATQPDGTRIEIKARRVTPENSSLQLSAIRGLGEGKFDYLLGIIFEADFSLRYAALIPHDLVAPNARFSEHSNAHFLRLTEQVIGQARVEDISAALAV